MIRRIVLKTISMVVSLLHTNELPLRHVFATLDGATSGPDTFAGPIGKKNTVSFIKLACYTVQADICFLFSKPSTSCG